ncbi:hypothetical protein PHET_00881 [Paragonimus heterotremus]|uniref:Uncharacterized protein n=1 Tax=Paragonimus heterotremus TaxID=100268 RepID=A0A8J4X3D4_9TREM|nr:hypothetical protein PHET_00881 [Paragonimus heterotremus]
MSVTYSHVITALSGPRIQQTSGTSVKIFSQKYALVLNVSTMSTGFRDYYQFVRSSLNFPLNSGDYSEASSTIRSNMSCTERVKCCASWMHLESAVDSNEHHQLQGLPLEHPDREHNSTHKNKRRKPLQNSRQWKPFIVKNDGGFFLKIRADKFNEGHSYQRDVPLILARTRPVYSDGYLKPEIRQAISENHQDGRRTSSPTRSQTRKSYVETTFRRHVHPAHSSQSQSVRVMATQPLTQRGKWSYSSPLRLQSYQFSGRKMRYSNAQKICHGKLDKKGDLEAFLLSKPQSAMDRHNQPLSVLNNSVRSGMAIRKRIVAIQVNRAIISLNPVNLMHVPHQIIGKNRKINHHTHLWASISWPISKNRPISPRHHVRYLPVCNTVVVLLNCSENLRSVHNIQNILYSGLIDRGMNSHNRNETVHFNVHTFNLTHAYRMLAGDELTDDVSITATEHFVPSKFVQAITVTKPCNTAEYPHQTCWLPNVHFEEHSLGLFGKSKTNSSYSLSTHRRPVCKTVPTYENTICSRLPSLHSVFQIDNHLDRETTTSQSQMEDSLIQREADDDGLSTSTQVTTIFSDSITSSMSISCARSLGPELDAVGYTPFQFISTTDSDYELLSDHDKYVINGWNTNEDLLDRALTSDLLLEPVQIFGIRSAPTRMPKLSDLFDRPGSWVTTSFGHGGGLGCSEDEAYPRSDPHHVGYLQQYEITCRTKTHSIANMFLFPLSLSIDFKLFIKFLSHKPTDTHGRTHTHARAVHEQPLFTACVDCILIHMTTINYAYTRFLFALVRKEIHANA